MKKLFNCSPLLGVTVSLAIVAPAAEAQFCPACTQSTPVQAGDTPFVGSPTGCRIEPEQGGCPIASNNTKFFRFVPSQSGAYRISTCDGAWAGGITVLSLWADCEQSSFMACAVFGCPSNGIGGSLIGDVELDAGLTYFIGVGAFGAPDLFVEGGVLSIDLIDAKGSGCSSATPAFVGVNLFDNTDRNEIVNLAGYCDPAPQGGDFDDRLYNVQYFTFVPPSSGVYTISTCGQGEQTWERLAVLLGCLPSDGVAACSNANCSSSDDYTGSTIVGVEMIAGVEYKILVGGVTAGQAGPGAFTIAPFVPCPSPKPTVFEVEACGEDLNSACPGSPKAAQQIELGDSVRGTFWASDAMRDADWYVFQINEGTEVTLELNSRIPSFATFYYFDCTTSLFVDQTSGVCPGLTDGECLPAGTYLIVVTPYDLWGFPCGDAAGNEYTLTVTGRPCDASAPPNDLCPDALTVTEGSTPFDNYFAATDINFATCNLIGRDVWFRFTATRTGDYKISTCNGPVPFNSGMDIWTDCPDFGGQLLKCNRDANDPACGDSTLSGIVLPMVAGQTVLVRVGSEWLFDYLPPGESEFVVAFIGTETVCGDPDAGDCCIARKTPFCSDMACCNSVCIFDSYCCAERWDEACVGSAALWCFDSCGAPPANDDCSEPSAAVVGANPFRNRQTEGLTQTPCGPIHYDVWYEYTATTDQPVSISLCDADGGWALVTGGDSGDLDTVIAVLDVCGGTVLACNDNACGVRSRVAFTPTCGATYLIVVGSRSDIDGVYSQGIGQFTITQAGSCGPACPADLNGDGAVGAQDLATLLGAWGLPAGDLNGDGTTSAQDLAALLTAWGPCP